MKKLFLSVCCLVLINCKKSEPQSLNANLVDVLQNDKVDASIRFSSEKTISEKTTSISRKVIKNGDMKIQVADINKVQSQISTFLKNNKAYIQKEEFQNNDLDENLHLIIRVPHQNFDALINSFSTGVGSVLSKNISSDDVTEEYTDVSIKLANKKIYLEKYRDMLKSAKTTKDILEIQENIRDLEDEIDVSEGRLRFIDDRVNYSTLNLNLYKEKIRSSATSGIGFGSRFSDSLTEGWNSFVEFFLGIISLWPFFLFIPVVVFSWRKWRSRRKNNLTN
ncbi:DUF4349 domain-containing protein [Chryseobacterium sp. SN22]|uniref:DUF4349 domain-containing protein n=1 Tax=Chryseobacterium sp. SN22 TaxID=2606431 RepID=UPI0011EFE2C9|nr:DUF4349 domain-containing protein [Chryseobacterium sp. SN22]KAA0130665.1 DUF4349 domain-containing protein [Chryseobacterium sp. SN22]